MSLNEDTELKGDRMKKIVAAAACSLLCIITAVGVLPAQLAAPTTAGVSLGAVYYTVPDVAAHRKIWVDIFGARPVMVGKTEMLKIPGAFIVLTKGEAAAGNPLVNHLGIWAKDLDPTRAKLTAAGIPTMPKAQFIDLPNALRLEFIDDPAGPDAPAAHHIHYFVANQQDGLNARAWYVKTFGATENSRRNGGVPSALLTTPDKWISLDFTAAGGRGRGGAAAPPPPAPASNKGTILDRFALEVKGIDAFVKKIEGEGVKVTKSVSTNADGLKTAMIVDSLGNDVELIEGLSGK
jgi:predicted enzyme related to lactoylglutathione lyase